MFNIDEDHIRSAADHVERKGSSKSQMNKGVRQSYDMNFKIMVARVAENTNNVQASKKYGVPEVNIRLWRKNLEKYKCANSTRKAFRGPSKGRFEEIENHVLAFIVEKRDEGFPITRVVITLKALEVGNELNIPRSQFKGSMGWCKRMMR